MSLLALLLFVASAATEPACGHAQGTDGGIVTVTVAGAEVNCKIAVRGEVTGPLAVQVTILPAASGGGQDWTVSSGDTVCPLQAPGEERIRPANCRP